jgi:hypothetical protein
MTLELGGQYFLVSWSSLFLWRIGCKTDIYIYIYKYKIVAVNCMKVLVIIIVQWTQLLPYIEWNLILWCGVTAR